MASGTIVGITGTIGAGKGTVVEYLKEKYGFVHFSASNFITEEIVRRGLIVSRDTMTDVGNSLRAEHGPGYIVEELYERAKKSLEHVVIESIRTKGEIDSLRMRGPLVLFAVDADSEVRYERIKKRKSVKDMISYEKFLSDEAREMESTDPNNQNIKTCIEHADFLFTNNGEVKELCAKVDEVMGKIL